MSGTIGDNVYRASGVIATAAAAGGGAWEYIARQTLGSDTAAIEFINGTAATDGTPDFSSTYVVLKFHLGVFAPTPSSAIQPICEMSTDGGSSYLSTGYLSGYNFVEATVSAAANNPQKSTGGNFRLGTTTVPSLAAGMRGYVYCQNPSDTSTYPSIWFQFMAQSIDAATMYSYYGSSLHTTAGDLDALKFYFDSGNVLSGSTIRMYGLKAS